MRVLIYITLVVLLSSCHDGIVEQPDDTSARNDTTVTEKKDSIDTWEAVVDTTFTINGEEL